MKKLLYIIATILGINANACDCFYFGGFAFSNQLADLVVYGKVIDYDSVGTKWSPDLKMSIRFEIIEKYRGIETKDTIIVLGDNGAECRPYISTFKPNSKWILALNTFGKDYEISSCGEFYLQVEKDFVRGRIFGRETSEPEKEIHIEKIKEIINFPYLYPIYRKKDGIKINEHGLEYHLLCEKEPKCALNNAEINRLINDKIKLPEIIKNSNSKLLVHATVIITETNELEFIDLIQANTYSFDYLIDLENQIEKILKTIETWQCGFINGNPVNAQMIIPIMIEIK